jgi:hypothetical protein
VAGLGGALASFGLLGYVASGLAPAAFASSILLFVPVDPVTNTVCVGLGLALTTLASRHPATGHASARVSGPDRRGNAG